MRFEFHLRRAHVKYKVFWVSGCETATTTTTPSTPYGSDNDIDVVTTDDIELNHDPSSRSTSSP